MLVHIEPRLDVHAPTLRNPKHATTRLTQGGRPKASSAPPSACSGWTSPSPTTPPYAAGPRRWRCRDHDRAAMENPCTCWWNGPEAVWRGRVAAGEAWHQTPPVLAEAAHRHGCRDWPD